jgi:hypothetical protein
MEVRRSDCKDLGVFLSLLILIINTVSFKLQADNVSQFSVPLAATLYRTNFESGEL